MPVLTLIVALVLAALIAALVMMQPRGPARDLGTTGAAASLSEDEKQYVSQVEFSGARMSAADNFLGHTVTYLDAQVTNHGQKAVRETEVQLEFVDTMNQVVLRETAHPINARTAPLQPGQTRAFRVTFDHMPMDWNQAPPRMMTFMVRF